MLQRHGRGVRSTSCSAARPPARGGRRAREGRVEREAAPVDQPQHREGKEELGQRLDVEGRACLDGVRTQPRTVAQCHVRKARAGGRVQNHELCTKDRTLPVQLAQKPVAGGLEPSNARCKWSRGRRPQLQNVVLAGGMHRRRSVPALAQQQAVAVPGNHVHQRQRYPQDPRNLEQQQASLTDGHQRALQNFLATRLDRLQLPGQAGKVGLKHAEVLLGLRHRPRVPEDEAQPAAHGHRRAVRAILRGVLAFQGEAQASARLVEEREVLGECGHEDPSKREALAQRQMPGLTPVQDAEAARAALNQKISRMRIKVENRPMQCEAVVVEERGNNPLPLLRRGGCPRQLCHLDAVDELHTEDAARHEARVDLRNDNIETRLAKGSACR
mmetsp:Transcript_7937/g.24109  ORF Transcript_7937/g.24109 Transcript_7937/m.24109 type:complete len:386 (-) Transcript_7937:462-1619(-)